MGVLFTYNQNVREAEQVVNVIRGLGVPALALQLDATKPSTFPRFIGEVKRGLREVFQAEKFDVLVNNAGTAQRQPIRTTTEGEIDELFAVHFRGPFLLAQKLEVLLHDGGRIINVSEFANRQICVNCVAPGALDTDFGGGRTEEARKILSGLTPFSRMGTAEDVGQLISHLMSPETVWMTGQTIGVSGGQIL